MTPIVYCRKIGENDFNFCNMDEICGKKNMEFYVGNFPQHSFKEVAIFSTIIN